MTMGVAIIGCGLIGAKRARALSGEKLVICADRDRGRAERLAASVPGADSTEDWRHAVRHSSVQLVLVATTNDALAAITLEAIRAGKHVLVEKPAARNAAEVEPLIPHARHFQARGASKGKLQAKFSDNSIDYARILRRLQETAYTGFFKRGADKEWKRLATFRVKTGGRPLKGYYSFVEHFRRDGKSPGLRRGCG